MRISKMRSSKYTLEKRAHPIVIAMLGLFTVMTFSFTKYSQEKAKRSYMAPTLV